MSNDTQTEAQVLQSIIAGLSAIDEDARPRILETVARFFDLHSPIRSNAQRHTSVLEPAHLEPSDQDEAGTPTPKQFLIDKNPRTLVERVACLAYYLTHFRGTAHFRTFDVSTLNTEAAQTKFSNTAQSVNDATKAGLLAASTKGNKQLSAFGEEYVKALPDRDMANAVKKRMRPKKKNRRKSTTKK